MVGDREELPGIAWLVRGRERPQYRIPASLSGLLEQKGLSLDVLSPSDRRHALSMIHEARAGSTLAERTADLVRFLEDRKDYGVPS
ncbi:hypothetical protein [Sphaerisporangium aureirubrum]|uniref:Integrase n=1 Tax=Sphaerisporangium aureirubrum TaxID=1544736 RepID=A0ABW1NNC3_9ACTN